MYKLTTEEFISRCDKKHSNKYDYSKIVYVDSKSILEIICPVHGEFSQKVNKHLHLGRGCPWCGESKKLTTKEFIEKSHKVHKNKYDYSKVKYTSAHEKVIIICKKHGKFNQSSNSHVRGIGCPKCKRSKGEEEISDILTEKNIKFITEHKFDNCRNKRILSFDFYLPKYNLCIEYDGEQHFKSGFFGEKAFKSTQINDEIKNNFCKNNNINLLRIKYTEKNNIKSILNFIK